MKFCFFLSDRRKKKQPTTNQTKPNQTKTPTQPKANQNS